MCLIQTELPEKAYHNSVPSPLPDVWTSFLIKGEPDSCRCKVNMRSSNKGLHKRDIYCLCLIRASGKGWDSLLLDGEHCYEDGQSLCSLSEAIV